jgi:ribonucleoside-diphosphate reductase alpha chain
MEHAPYSPTGFALDIFQKRYTIHEQETFGEACDRVARHISQAEPGESMAKFRSEFSDILSKNLFMPGGRIWYGSGRPKGNLLNCFVVPTADSREGWGKTTYDMIVISGTGGGVGTNYSPVRPRGSVINGSGGKATGAVSLMSGINAFGEVIKAGGGRRTALMMALNHNHGDIIEFLDAKLDQKQLNNANVSVIFDEDPEAFFDQVKKDLDIDLKFRGKAVGKVKARELWARIVKNALKGGEPGVLNGYFANKMNNVWGTTPLICTNPCFHPDTLLSTEFGLMRAGELAGIPGALNVVADSRVGKGNSLDSAAMGTVTLPSTGVYLTQVDAPIFRVTTSHGYSVVATDEHDFVTTKGRKKLKDLVVGDQLMLPSGDGLFGPNGSYDEGLVLGMFVGDGTSARGQTESEIDAFIDVWESDFDSLESVKRAVEGVVGREPSINGRQYSCEWIKQGDGKFRIGGRRLARALARMSDDGSLGSLKNKVPRSVFTGSREFVAGYIAGLFFADGTVNISGHAKGTTVSWRINQSNIGLLSDVQILLSQFGVVSRTYLRRSEQDRLMPDGRGGKAMYRCRDNYELIVNRPNLIRLSKKIRLVGRKALLVASALEARGIECRRPERYITTVTGVDAAGRSDVYCLTQPATNCIISNGIVNGQCGEIWLGAYESCCLGSIVLPRFVDSDGSMDWDELKRTVSLAVRFLDDVLTVNNYPLPEIKSTVTDLRRIGLGVMGVHDMLLMLGHRYNSAEGLEFVDKVEERIKNWSYEASIELAKEKGSFPMFNPEQFVKSGFVKTLKPSLREKIRRFGIRNCALLTIAPTGTTSMVADVTSGIEPMFAAAYKRRYQNNEVLTEEVVIHPLFKSFMDAGKSVEHFQGAHDISMRDHLEMQRTCQRHLDNACSKTINVPAGTSESELGELYMEYLPELKGVTVYPDGSRENQPLTPISLEEAVATYRSARVETEEGRCKSGVCSL